MLCQLTGPGNNHPPEAASTPAAQTLVSDFILQREEPGLPGEVADLSAGAGAVPGEPERLAVPRSKEVLEKQTQSHHDGPVGGSQEPVGGAPSGQSCTA